MLLFQEVSPDPVLVPGGLRQPEALTPEVMIFFAFLAFLALFGGPWGGGK